MKTPEEKQADHEAIVQLVLDSCPSVIVVARFWTLQGWNVIINETPLPHHVDDKAHGSDKGDLLVSKGRWDDADSFMRWKSVEVKHPDSVNSFIDRNTYPGEFIRVEAEWRMEKKPDTFRYFICNRNLTVAAVIDPQVRDGWTKETCKNLVHGGSYDVLKCPKAAASFVHLRTGEML